MKHKTMFRLLLKVIGVWLFMSGASALVGVIASVSLYFIPSLGLAGRPWLVLLLSFLNPLLQLAAGAYLFFDGKWIADKAIPGNRPYCHECGYDLTGAAGHVCNECGTPFRIAVQPMEPQMNTDKPT